MNQVNSNESPPYLTSIELECPLQRDCSAHITLLLRIDNLAHGDIEVIHVSLMMFRMMAG